MKYLVKISSIIIFLFSLQHICIAQENSNNDSIHYINLKKAIKDFEIGKFQSGLNILNELITLAEQENNYKILTQTYLNMGILYYRLSESEEALNFYFKALEIAKENKLDILFNSIYNNIGIIYSNNNDAIEAKKYFEKALHISQKLADQERIEINLINLSNLEVDQENYAKAQEYLSQAKLISEETNNKKNLQAIHSILGLIYEKQEKYLLAKNNHLKAVELEKLNGDKMLLSTYSFHLATAYNNLGMNDSALTIFFESLNIAKEIKHKDIIINACSELAKTYKQIGNIEKSILYFEQSIAWKDSLINEKSQKWISEMQMKYEFGKQQTEIEFLERRNKSNRIIWILSIATLLITILFIIYSFRSRIIKSKQRNTLLKQEKELNKLELQKSEAENKCLTEEMKANEEINTIKQEQLQQEIEHKNRELTSNALHLVNKNAILQDIQDQIKIIRCDNISESQNTIRNILRLISTNVNLDSDWDSFKLHFEEVHGNFFNRIQEIFPTLNQNDLRLCAYLLINLNPKEIAQISNISPDSVRKRKQRLREKLNLDSEVDIAQFLAKFQ